MANDFKKDDFQKDEPAKACISCEAVDEFVLVRRPMQEMHLHRDQYRRKRGEYEQRSLEGYSALHGKLLDNIFGRLSEPVNEFTQTLNNWNNLRRSHGQSNQKWLLEIDQLLGAKDPFFRRLVGGVLAEHQEAIQTVLRQILPHQYTNKNTAQQRRNATEQHLRGKDGTIANGIVARFTERGDAHEAVGTVLKREFAIHQVHRALPETQVQHKEFIETLTKAIEDEMKQYQALETDWDANFAKNDPDKVPRPRHLSTQIPEDAFYEGVHHCAHCGAIQSRTFNIRCTINPMQGENDGSTITYDGPTKDLFEHLKPQLDRIWAEPLDELEARIAKATKLLQTGEKRYNKRMADEKEKARQEEIRALKEKLESLENGE